MPSGDNVKIDIVDQSHLYRDPDEDFGSDEEPEPGPVDQFFVKGTLIKIMEDESTSTYRGRNERRKELLTKVNRSLKKDGIISHIKSEYAEESTRKSEEESVQMGPQKIWLPGDTWIEPKPQLPAGFEHLAP